MTENHISFVTLMQLTTDDLLQAAQIEERGMLDRKDRSSETWRQVAINEAAMAVVAVNFPDMKNIEFVGFSNLFPPSNSLSTLKLHLSCLPHRDISMTLTS